MSLIPKNSKLALFDPNWEFAMQSEFDTLIRNKTWDLVPRPCDSNLIRFVWIFRHKKIMMAHLSYKACLVGDGMSQIVGVNCDETFSPIVNPYTISIFSPLLYQNCGPFIIWMYVMHFYTVISMRLFTCITHWVPTSFIIQIMFVF